MIQDHGLTCRPRMRIDILRKCIVQMCMNSHKHLHEVALCAADRQSHQGEEVKPLHVCVLHRLLKCDRSNYSIQQSL